MSGGGIHTAFRHALRMHEAGRIGEAVALYQGLVKDFPDPARILYLLGSAELQLGRAAPGVEHLRLSLQHNGKQPLAWANLGMGLHLLGRYDDAVAALERARAQAPDNAGTHFNLGNSLQALGRKSEALAAYDRALALAPDFAAAHNNRGNLLRDLGRPSEALECFGRALALKPDFAEAWNNKGTALRALKRKTEALAAYDRAVALKPDFGDAHYNRANVLIDLNRADLALKASARAVTLMPGDARALNSHGAALRELARPVEAEKRFDAAISRDPGYAEAWNNRGNARLDCGRFDEAAADFQEALKRDPDYAAARWNTAFLTLMNGDFAAGWPLFETRWTGSRLRDAEEAYDAPLWLGEVPLAGKRIFLHAEQGLGDTVQFCRYAPMVAALGAGVVLEVPAPLKRLISTLDGVPSGQVRVIARGEEPPPDTYDYHCPLMSLPLAFRSDLATIPAKVPYLSADPALRAIWREKLGQKQALRVGLVWSGQVGLPPDQYRSMPAAELAPLMALPCEFHCLQKVIRERDAAAVAGWPQIRTHTEYLGDFADTAALIAEMDLVISVDTSVAHVAAALGKPVWLLLPLSPDWRWMRDRADSPWYPGMRIFRQKTRRDWAGQMAEVAAELQDFI